MPTYWVDDDCVRFTCDGGCRKILPVRFQFVETWSGIFGIQCFDCVIRNYPGLAEQAKQQMEQMESGQ